MCLLSLVFAASALAQREPLSEEEQALVESRWPEAKRTITGIRYVMQAEGEGEPARSGDRVAVVYKGMLLDGTVFNEYTDREKAFSFRLGRGEVIEGWDQAFKLLKVGSKATLIIPFELAYGTRGNPPSVPRKSTLVFEVELLSIERGATPPPPPANEGKKKKKKD